MPSATVMVVAVLLVRSPLHAAASSSVAFPAKTVARAAPARRRVSTAAATAAVFHPDNWLSGHVYPAALPLSSLGRSETAELAQVGIMFFSAAQTPPSHHSPALSLAPFHIVFLISPLSLPLYEVFPSPAAFFFRIPWPRLAHSSCPRPAKNRNIGLAAEQRRSCIQDDEVPHSHFHMPSLSIFFRL